MSVIENLLHLRRRQCEERRRYLVELDLLAQRLRADARRLRAEIERADYPALARSLIERHAKLERSVAAIDGQIVTAGDALAVAERELQRNELASMRRTGNAGLAKRRPARRSPRARPAPAPIDSPRR